MSMQREQREQRGHGEHLGATNTGAPSVPALRAPLTRRRYLGLALNATATGGTLALATACGGPRSVPERAIRSSEPVTVEVWVEPPKDDFLPYWEKTLLPSYKERFPQATVEFVWPGWT